MKNLSHPARTLILIALGGAAGALTRFAAHDTPLVNTLGCFALALLLAVAEAPVLRRHPALRIGIATGFIGAFTTFSTLCGEIAERFLRGDVVDALFYSVYSLGLGFLAVMAGHRLGRWAVARFRWGHPGAAREGR